MKRGIEGGVCRVAVVLGVLLGVSAVASGAPDSRQFAWPTPLPVKAGTAWEDFVQASASGNPATGLFGTARNGGGKFHEGLDIRAVARDRRGEATDAVCAVLGGVVAHVAPVSNGAYGRHVVVWHTEAGLRFYTLYAHLSTVAPGLKPGVVVNAGSVLGVMGRSDGARGFPKERAHLHFEIGLRLAGTFERWYARQREFTVPNRQGSWNGLNLVGLDPLPFLREGLSTRRAPALLSHVRRERVAVVAHVATRQIPAFVRENPALLAAPLPGVVEGWKIEFAWHGMPVRWTPLEVAPGGGTGMRSLRLGVVDDKGLQRQARARGLLVQRRNGSLVAGTTLINALAILFDW
ncbi:MAG: M23 family metallopeptidase [Puniceicoccales bacterium]|jgi:hypothetical protein|nr:M23 family metallopeptidase [Puniceicoccales bacterium]